MTNKIRFYNTREEFHSLWNTDDSKWLAKEYDIVEGHRISINLNSSNSLYYSLTAHWAEKENDEGEEYNSRQEVDIIYEFTVPGIYGEKEVLIEETVDTTHPDEVVEAMKDVIRMGVSREHRDVGNIDSLVNERIDDWDAVFDTLLDFILGD